MHKKSPAQFWNGFVGASLLSAGRAALALSLLAGACGALPAAEPTDNRASDSNLTPANFAEDIAAGAASVLIDAREADPDEPMDEGLGEVEPLVPISRVSDHEPELASDLLPLAGDDVVVVDDLPDEEEEASQFGEALTRAVDQLDEPRRGATTRRQPDVSSTADTAAEARAKIAKFNGIQPGTSSTDDIVDAWGQPVDQFNIQGGMVLIYDTAPFRQIEVVVTRDVVDTIKIQLERKLPSQKLIEQLGLEDIEPADVLNDSGQVLGQIFPERGVLFMHDIAEDDESLTSLGGSGQVTDIVIQPLDPVAFTLRAENHLHGPYEKNIRDLKLALALDADSAHAQWLLADIYLATGQAKQAEVAARAAFELDPGNDAYRLRWARSLEMLAQYDEAVHETRAVLDGDKSSQVVKAQALHQMGRLATLGGIEIRTKAIPFYNKAIEVADGLATSEDINERRAAKELLIDAHLSIAREISAQKFNDKLESISQWVARASGLAEDTIAHDDGSLELRLRVAEASLACLAELKPTRNPAAWLGEAQNAADDLIAQHDDTLWQRRVKWQLGVAYFHAIRTEHTRRQTASALRFGEKAIDNLAEGAKSREAVPDSEHLVVRLYFHIGAIHAVHERDHESAVTWYDKADPLLTAPVPVTELAVPRRHGEALVSMGVTYWQVGQKMRALELTEAGANLVEKAVAGGVLEKDALGVPYGNLATMHRELGNTSQGAKYANLAQNAKTTGGAAVPVAPISGGNTASRPATSSRRVASQPVRNTTQQPANTSGMNVHPEQRRRTGSSSSPTSSNDRSAAASNRVNVASNVNQTRRQTGGTMNRTSPRPRRVSQSYGNGGYSSAPGM
jgi:tetratricopeptide (TPR) repeat protein